MKILINFSTLKRGGGQNVALNFLYKIFSLKIQDLSLFFFVAQDSEAEKFLKKIGYKNYKILPKNPIKRIIFEKFFSDYLIKNWNIDIIYSYFGYGLFNRSYIQVIGSADSNLYFPEVDFWKDYTEKERLKKRLIDNYRIYGIKNAHAVIFENPLMEKRGIQLFNLKETKYIKPSINLPKYNEKFLLPNEIKKNIPKGLFLTGWHLNKNILKIPEIAFELKKKKIKYQFILTAPKDNSLIYKKFLDLVNKFNVHDMCFVVGTVKKEQLKSLYEQIDHVFLLSRLESFSNNIIEAWYFKKPLIITNALWSKYICEDAAIYVNRDDAKDIANKINILINNKNFSALKVKKGMQKLQEYPSIEERIYQEMEYLKYVYKKFN